ncbi:MAG: hypothetical protein ACXWJB_12295 [Limisphaerales bacterium]
MNFKRLLWITSSVLLIVSAHAAILEPFQWLNPLPTGNSFLTAAYGNGTYIAFDNIGNILESTNTMDWSVRSNVTSAPTSACYGNSAFVAVGKHGFTLARINGNWTATPSSTTNDLNQVIFANGSFWAVGANGTILSSTDGVNWSARSSGTAMNLASIAYGNGIFLAVSADWNFDFTSTDGSTWNASANAPGAGYNAASYSRVAFGNGHFLKLGWTSSNKVAGGQAVPDSRSSTNGVDWVYETPYFVYNGFAPPSRLIYGQGHFILISPRDGSLLSYTTLGYPANSWTYISPPDPVNDVIAGDGCVMTVGNSGLTGKSFDAFNWSFVPATPALNAQCLAIASSSNAVVAVGTPANTGTILISTNGSPFFTNSSGFASYMLLDIVYTNGSYVAVGANGEILKSTDAVTWSVRSSGTTLTLRAITFASGRFVVVGQNGLIMTSSSGDAWTGLLTGGTASFNSVTYGAGTYVAVGDGGLIRSSTDALSWSDRQSSVTNSIIGVAYGNGTFVALCDNGTALKSSDAINWFSQLQATPIPVSRLYYDGYQRIIFDGYQFICACPSSTILTSIDGSTWVTHVFNCKSTFKGVCATPNGLLLCGDNGVIIQCGPLREPQIISQQFSSLPFRFNVQGEINHVYILQTSTDLTAWTSLSSFTNISSVTQVSDTSSNAATARFYRIASSAAQ